MSSSYEQAQRTLSDARAIQAGAEFNTVRDCRAVSAAWPHDSRESCSWAVHRQLMSPENRSKIRDGMTVREARAAAGGELVPGTQPQELRS